MTGKQTVLFFSAVAATAFFAEGRASDDGCVKASSFGWDAVDATECLQKAIDSGAGKVVVDRQAGDWIVRPVFLRTSGQEVVLEDGVTVRAKKGEFKRIADNLLCVPASVTNVILRGEGKAVLVMNKKDYMNRAEYRFSEWRHTVSVLGGKDIVIRDLTVLSSGGDGVYIRGAAENVRLDNLDCRDHYRQGISIISVAGLHVTNCRFDATSGTAPECGLDIEPNGPTDRLEDIVFEDCEFNSNASSGIQLHFLNLTPDSRPVSVTFRRCRLSGNRRSGVYAYCAGCKGAVKGTVLFDGCEMSGNRIHAFGVARKRSDALDITVRNCLFDGRGSSYDTVEFSNGTETADFGGVSFVNVRVIPGGPGAVAYDGLYGTGLVPGTMKGWLDVETKDGKKERVDMVEFSRRHPPRPEFLKALADFKTDTPDYVNLKVSNVGKEMSSPSSTGWLRGRFTFVQALPGAGEYPVKFHLRTIGRAPVKATVKVNDAFGTNLGTFTLKGGTSTHVIRATTAGLRRFDICVENGRLQVESRFPGQAIQADTRINLFGGRNLKYYFTVPADADRVRVEIRPEEPCSARILRPDGSVAAEMPVRTGRAVLGSGRAKSAAPEVWCLEFPYVQEDALFRIGLPSPPFVSLQKDCMFHYR